MKRWMLQPVRPCASGELLVLSWPDLRGLIAGFLLLLLVCGGFGLFVAYG